MSNISKLLIFALSAFLIAPITFYGQISQGLDPSWAIALHLAIENGLVFGKDFVFTYGPLGFLSTRLPFESTRLAILAHDIFFFGTLFFCIAYITVTTKRLVYLLVLPIIFHLAGGLVYFTDLAIVEFAVMAFLVSLFLKTGRAGYLLWACLTSVIILFNKLNLGMVALGVTGFLVLKCAFFQPRRLPLALLALGTQCLALLFITWAIPVDLPGYLKGSIEIASGYNDGMFIAPVDRYGQLRLALIILSFAGCIFVGALLNKRPNLDDVIFTLICAGFLFLVFKQSFVRADDHTFTLFQYTPGILGIFIFHFKEKLKSWQIVLFALVITCCLTVRFKADIKSQIESRILGLANYYSSISDQNRFYEPPTPQPATEMQINRLLRKIKGDTVDIIPWEISLAFHNKLNYKPRPIMQSYSAYTPYLDGLNAQFFTKNTAPKFVLWSAECVDQRYCFWDESNTKLSLLEHYNAVDCTANRALLQRTKPKRIELKKVLSGTGQLNRGFNLPKDSERLYFARFNFEYSVLGKLLSFIYQPAEIRVQFRDAKRNLIQENRAVRRILEGGVIAGRLINSPQDFQNFLHGNHSELTLAPRMRFFSKQPWAFKPDYKYEIFSITIPESSTTAPLTCGD